MKRSKKPKNKCVDCNKEISRVSTRCAKCGGKNSTSKLIKFNPSKEELELLIKQHSINAVGRYYKVTDNTIRKRCTRLGIDWRTINKTKKGL